MKQFNPNEATRRQIQSLEMLRPIMDLVSHRGVFSSKTGFPFILVDVGGGETVSISARITTDQPPYIKVFRDFADPRQTKGKIIRGTQKVIDYLEELRYEHSVNAA
jgi:hypothetical protein